MVVGGGVRGISISINQLDPHGELQTIAMIIKMPYANNIYFV